MKTLFYNGIIYTLDTATPLVEAVFVHDGIIQAIGSNEDMQKWVDDATKIVDLQNRFVYPGFNDAHLHLYGFSHYLRRVNLIDSTSIEEVIARTKQFIKTHNISPTTPIIGRGWNQNQFSEKRSLTKADLDEISLTQPIALSRICGHVSVLNSVAIRQLGLSEASHVDGGSINVHTGELTEKALMLIDALIDEPSLEELKDMLCDGMRIANSKGITSLQVDDLNHLPKSDFTKMLQAYNELKAENRLTTRLYLQCLLPEMPDLDHFLSLGYKTHIGDHFLKVGPLKILIDGSLGARTAALIEPYSDADTKGILTYSDESLYALMEKAHLAGMQLAVHAIGDAAHEQILRLFDRLLTQHPKDNHRHGIVHAQVTNPGILHTMKRLDIIAYIQPIFLNSDIPMVKERLGDKRASESYAFKEMLDLGIHAPISTDCPVEPIDALPNIQCAVTRQTLDGQLTYRSDQAYSVEEALKGYTIEGAYASFEEHIKGKLIPGFVADFSVLEKDLYHVPKNSIKDVKVLYTYLQGNPVFSHDA